MIQQGLAIALVAVLLSGSGGAVTEIALGESAKLDERGVGLPEDKAAFIQAVWVDVRGPGDSCQLGCIYLIGGEKHYLGNGGTSSIHRYDVQTHQIEAAGDLDGLDGFHPGLTLTSAVFDPRDRPEAGCKGGCIYILGGWKNAKWGGGVTGEILRYSPTSGQTVRMDAQLPDPVCGAAAVYLGGYIYVMGGDRTCAEKHGVGQTCLHIRETDPECTRGVYSDYADSIQRYDPISDQVQEMWAKLPFGRARMPAATDGTAVYMFGGEAGVGSTGQTADIVRYVPWMDLTAENAVAQALGGRSPAAETWDELPCFSSGASAAYVGDSFLITSGYNMCNNGNLWQYHPRQDLRGIFPYNPAEEATESWLGTAGTWGATRLPYDTDFRYGVSAAYDGQHLLVFGGYNEDLHPLQVSDILAYAHGEVGCPADEAPHCIRIVRGEKLGDMVLGYPTSEQQRAAGVEIHAAKFRTTTATGPDDRSEMFLHLVGIPGVFEPGQLAGKPLSSSSLHEVTYRTISEPWDGDVPATIGELSPTDPLPGPARSLFVTQRVDTIMDRDQDLMRVGEVWVAWIRTTPSAEEGYYWAEQMVLVPHFDPTFDRSVLSAGAVA